MGHLWGYGYCLHNPVSVKGGEDQNDVAYRFALERFESGVYVDVPDNESRMANIDSRTVEFYGLALGQYRLLSYASEGAGQPEFMVSKVFHVVSDGDPENWSNQDKNWILYNFDRAVLGLRSELNRVHRKNFRMVDVSAEFEVFSSGDLLMNYLRNEWVRGAEYGNFYPASHVLVTQPLMVVGNPRDGDATGQIVLEVRVPPTSADDWRATEIAVTLPAYPPVDGLKRKTVVIRWNE